MDSHLDAMKKALKHGVEEIGLFHEQLDKTQNDQEHLALWDEWKPKFKSRFDLLFQLSQAGITTVADSSIILSEERDASFEVGVRVEVVFIGEGAFGWYSGAIVDHGMDGSYSVNFDDEEKGMISGIQGSKMRLSMLPDDAPVPALPPRLTRSESDKVRQRLNKLEMNESGAASAD